MPAGRPRRTTHAAAALALLLLAGCSSVAGGSPSAPPTAFAAAAPAFHLASLYAGAASSSVNDVRTSLVALSPRDGSILWSHPLSAAGASQVRPAYRFVPFERDGVVYVGTAYDTLAATGLGAIEALDASGGAVRWRRDVAGNIAGTPAVDGDTLYLSATQEGTGGQGQERGFVEALDARTGALRWHISVDGVTGLPIAGDGHVYLFVNRPYGTGTLLALNAADGSTAWRYDSPVVLIGGEDINTAPALIRGTVFAEAEERDLSGVSNLALLALDPRTGALRWRYKTGGIAPLPAVAGDVACVSTFIPAQSGISSVVAGLDLATGRERWRLTPSVIASACAPAGDRFVVAEDDRAHDTGYVVALAAQDGHDVWRHQTGHALIAAGAVPPAVTDGTVLAFAYAAQPAASSQRPGAALLALRAADGAVLWQVAAPDHQEQPPDVEGGVIYVPDLRALDAYSLRDGSLLWRQNLARA